MRASAGVAKRAGTAGKQGRLEAISNLALGAIDLQAFVDVPTGASGVHAEARGRIIELQRTTWRKCGWGVAAVNEAQVQGRRSTRNKRVVQRFCLFATQVPAVVITRCMASIAVAAQRRIEEWPAWPVIHRSIHDALCTRDWLAVGLAITACRAWKTGHWRPAPGAASLELSSSAVAEDDQRPA